MYNNSITRRNVKKTYLCSRATQVVSTSVAEISFFMSVGNQIIDKKRPWLKGVCECGGAMYDYSIKCKVCRASTHARLQICECGNKKGRYARKCFVCAGMKKGAPNRISENNPNWKGDKAGNAAVHNWVRRHKPKPDKCVKCKINEPKDLANISQTYKRDIDDYEWLCRKCHMHDDGRIFNLMKLSARPEGAKMKRAIFPKHWKRRT